MAEQSEERDQPRRWLRSRRGYQQAVLRDMQFNADKILMQKALEALDENQFQRYSELSGRALDQPQNDSTGGLEPTVHERYLDVKRVWITGGLLAALFTIVALVLFKSSIATTATPYVSLLSGLAGIALGWMFANAGGTSTQRAPARAPEPPKPASGTAPAPNAPAR
jgi:hypothetical protein